MTTKRLLPDEMKQLVEAMKRTSSPDLIEIAFRALGEITSSLENQPMAWNDWERKLHGRLCSIRSLIKQAANEQ